MLRVTLAFGCIGLLLAVFTFDAAFEGRGRDAVEGGVPAGLCFGVAAFTGWRAMRNLRG